MAERRRGRRGIGCLLTAPVGCGAFALGAVGVALVLMPSSCGPRIADAVEEHFREHHAGRLDVDRAHLPSFLGRQELRFELEDPGGRTVLRAELDAPSLPWKGPPVWGPVRLHLDQARIAVDEQGVTSLEHALARRDPGVPSSGRVEVSWEGVRRVEVALVADELAWTLPGPEPRAFVLRDVRGQGALEGEPTPTFRLAGTAEPEPGGEATTLAFELLVAEPTLLLDPRRAGLSLRVAGERVPSELVEAWLGSPGLLVERFGPLLEGCELVLALAPGGASELRLSVGSATFRIEGRGRAARLVEDPGG